MARVTPKMLTMTTTHHNAIMARAWSYAIIDENFLLETKMHKNAKGCENQSIVYQISTTH